MATIRQFLDKKKRTDVFVQVGTNNGADRFKDVVRDYKPGVVLLVEPNPQLIQEIKNNYKDISGVVIENVAIADKEGVIDLYLPWMDDRGRAKNGYYYTHSEFSAVPQNDWGMKKNMIKMTVQSVRLDSLLKKHSIRHIDYLCIDTEGYDAEVLKSLAIWSKKVDILQYENFNVDPTNFARHNENWDSLGESAMIWIKGVLSAMGYVFHEDSEDPQNTIAVIKKEDTWKEPV